MAAALIALTGGAAGAQEPLKLIPLRVPTKAKRADIYDPKADAAEQLGKAVAKAGRDRSRVLVMFGGNWCGWCHKLHELFAKDVRIAKLLRDEYVTVMVDTEAPHAAGLLERCKAALSAEELAKGVGYPFLAVIDGDGKVVTAQRTDPLEEGDHHDPGKVREFLAKWAAPRADARKVLDEGLARAASENKRVFLHFGAPWCGWCHELDDFLAREDVAAVFGRDFVDVKIDVDRTEGGKALCEKYDPARGGIPWSAFLDEKGEPVVTSDAPKGNIGYPVEPAEIDHFLAMLRKAGRRLGPDEVGRLEGVLKERAARIKAPAAAR